MKIILFYLELHFHYIVYLGHSNDYGFYFTVTYASIRVFMLTENNKDKYSHIYPII